MSRRCVLLSIKPTYAAWMYEGRKRFEYRRMKVSVRRGDTILMYESAPVSRLTGWFTAGQVIVDIPDKLQTLEADLVVRRAVAEYLNAARIGTAIEVTNPQKWHAPRVLTDVFPGRRPVQSYAFVEVEDDGLLCDH